MTTTPSLPDRLIEQRDEARAERDTLRAELAARTQPTPPAPVAQAANWEGADEWMPLAWELCANECGEEACNELIWEGGPISEPWGDRWLKYEDQAKEMIAMVRKHVPATPPAQPELTPVVKDCLTAQPEPVVPWSDAQEIYDEMERQSPSWNGYGKSREGAVALALKIVAEKIAVAPQPLPVTEVQQARQPLSEAEIEKLRQKDDCGEAAPEFERIVRLVERAHGITGEQP